MNIGDQNDRNRHQHISSPTCVTNIDLTHCRFSAIKDTIKELEKVLFSTQCIQNFGYEEKVSDMSQVFHRLRMIYYKNFEMILENRNEAFFTVK